MQISGPLTRIQSVDPPGLETFSASSIPTTPSATPINAICCDYGDGLSELEGEKFGGIRIDDMICRFEDQRTGLTEGFWQDGLHITDSL